MDEFSIGKKLGELTQKLIQLETHFTNHLHRHWVDRVINAIYFLAVIIMFCYLKWGK